MQNYCKYIADVYNPEMQLNQVFEYQLNSIMTILLKFDPSDKQSLLVEKMLNVYNDCVSDLSCRALVGAIHNICTACKSIQKERLKFSYANLLSRSIQRVYSQKKYLDIKSMALIKSSYSKIKYYHTLLDRI